MKEKEKREREREREKKFKSKILDVPRLHAYQRFELDELRLMGPNFSAFQCNKIILAFLHPIQLKMPVKTSHLICREKKGIKHLNINQVFQQFHFRILKQVSLHLSLSFLLEYFMNKKERKGK